MKGFKFLLLVLTILILDSSFIFSQSRWVKVYHDEIDAVGDMIIESYDYGYLLLGRHGHNYSKLLWLIKTNINGEILWEKTIGDGMKTITFFDMHQDVLGNTFLGGGSFFYDSSGDPIVMKINSCGEQQWCKVFYTDNNMDYSSCMALTQEGEPVVVLNVTNPDHTKDRICLSKLSADGEQIWNQCYNSSDTSQRNEITSDIICTPDQGFLITGLCYYEDPTVPNHWIPHPYLLKVDSTGLFEWETVIFKEANLDGGHAWSSIINPNENFYYSSISHYSYHDSTVKSSPAIAKLDLDGNVISVNNIVNGTKYGKLSYAQFLNDSTLAASAGWGNSDSDLWSRAVIIDTLGNLLISTVLMQDIYTSILQVTYDGKLVYASNTYQNDQFDFYLTKLNQNLEDDSLYTFPFTYDSLCPYQIDSDTIVQDDCELIVGVEEEEEIRRQGDKETRGELDIWPNPASGIVDCRLPIVDLRGDWTLMIYDIFGRPAPIPGPSPTRGKGEVWWSLDVSNLPPGVYFISILQDGWRVKGGKFVVSR
ncbi:MAG: T9SS type A sorting domain-containing protein [Bacteroidales bacterium]|nr:T9SS type A sorting domain-containing protein [Bacteroidales bacterium]